MPIYNAAICVVQQLKKDDITEIKNFASPSPAANIVFKTHCMMFDVKPKKLVLEKMQRWIIGILVINRSSLLIFKRGAKHTIKIISLKQWSS